MSRRRAATVTCPVCGQSRRKNEVIAGDFVRDPVAAEIRRDHPDWSTDSFVCPACLNRYRAEYLRRILEEEKGELTALESEVIQSLREQDSISEDVNAEFDRQLTFGERLSDHLADFGGSWTFLLLFAGCMLVWIAVNTFWLLGRPFDPYPFILLNLVLSCLAAVQAPIIMMSQNRQEARDRLRGEHDYRVNLKAELEIRLLHAKLDQLLTHQWERLLEIQQLQINLIEELANRGVVHKPPTHLGGD